jgi:hypothetical protein
MIPATMEIYGTFPAKALNSLRALREVSTVPIAESETPPIWRDGGGLRLRDAREWALISLADERYK